MIATRSPGLDAARDEALGHGGDLGDELGDGHRGPGAVDEPLGEHPVGVAQQPLGEQAGDARGGVQLDQGLRPGLAHVRPSGPGGTSTASRATQASRRRRRPAVSVPVTRPAARMSSSADSTPGRSAAGTASSTAVISVRIDTLASDLTLRSAASAAPAARDHAGVGVAGGGAQRRGVGHGARCTEPSRHHDQTSSVANGSTGANRRSSTSSARPSAARAEAVSGGTRVGAVGAVLDQLEVVVAERPEERLGQLQRAGVVVRLERRGRLLDDVGQAGEHRAVERLGDQRRVQGERLVGGAERERELATR